MLVSNNVVETNISTSVERMSSIIPITCETFSKTRALIIYLIKVIEVLLLLKLSNIIVYTTFNHLLKFDFTKNEVPTKKQQNGTYCLRVPSQSLVYRKDDRGYQSEIASFSVT